MDEVNFEFLKEKAKHPTIPVPLLIGAALIAFGSLLMLISKVGAAEDMVEGYNGPLRPDKVVCKQLSEPISNSFGHETKGGYFYSFDRDLSATVVLSNSWRVSMYDADFETRVDFTTVVTPTHIYSNAFNTGNETWSGWFEPNGPAGVYTLTVTVPRQKPSSNLCFDWLKSDEPIAVPTGVPTPTLTVVVTVSIPIATAEATPINDAPAIPAVQPTPTLVSNPSVPSGNVPSGGKPNTGIPTGENGQDEPSLFRLFFNVFFD